MSITEHQIEPLVQGDKLTRDEFLRRWEAMPGLRFAELIGGIVYMPSPVTEEHGGTHSEIDTWVTVYAAFTPGCKTGNNSTWFMQADAPQPDTHLRILLEYGGQSKKRGDYLQGAPELAAEACRSSTVYDLHQKLGLYRSASVLEYVAVLVREREIRWHRLVGEEYELLPVSADGIIRSVVFPGLWLEVEPFLQGNMRRVLETLQRGLDSPEHADFVARLATRRS